MKLSRYIPKIGKNLRYLSGMLSKDGSTRIGPLKALILPSNKCNLNCLGCYNYSDISSGKMKVEDELPLPITKNLIDDLSRLGTQEIIISGGGEPFCHNNFMQIVRLIKQKEMRCVITTNGTLIDKQVANDLVRIGVDELRVSVWAGTQETYSKVHPGHIHKFNQMKEMFSEIRKKKKKYNTKKPLIYLTSVIQKNNFRDIENMSKFGNLIRAEEILFKMINPGGYPKEKKDLLELDDSEKKELINILSNKNLDRNIKHNGSEIIELLKNPKSIHSKKNIPEACYMGWILTTINADGSVVPCCGSEMVLGNLHDTSFEKIWRSKTYSQFRKSAKKMSLDNMKGCTCQKYCAAKSYNNVVKKYMKIPLLFNKKI